jgi:hypothetical protein
MNGSIKYRRAADLSCGWINNPTTRFMTFKEPRAARNETTASIVVDAPHQSKPCQSCCDLPNSRAVAGPAAGALRKWILKTRRWSRGKLPGTNQTPAAARAGAGLVLGTGKIAEGKHLQPIKICRRSLLILLNPLFWVVSQIFACLLTKISNDLADSRCPLNFDYSTKITTTGSPRPRRRLVKHIQILNSLLRLGLQCPVSTLV